MTFSIIICDKYDLSLFPSFTKKAQFGVIWQKNVQYFILHILQNKNHFHFKFILKHPVEIKDK